MKAHDGRIGELATYDRLIILPSQLEIQCGDFGIVFEIAGITKCLLMQLIGLPGVTLLPLRRPPKTTESREVTRP